MYVESLRTQTKADIKFGRWDYLVILVLAVRVGGIEKIRQVLKFDKESEEGHVTECWLDAVCGLAEQCSTRLRCT